MDKDYYQKLGKFIHRRIEDITSFLHSNPQIIEYIETNNKIENEIILTQKITDIKNLNDLINTSIKNRDDIIEYININEKEILRLEYNILSFKNKPLGSVKKGIALSGRINKLSENKNLLLNKIKEHKLKNG